MDKTAAIAKLLNYRSPLRAMFFRPRKFCKSLTLDIAKAILAAGDLPPGVKPWPGYTPVGVGQFDGLAVHAELAARLEPPHRKLSTAHIVIHLNLAGWESGSEVKARIMQVLAKTALKQFGEVGKARVSSCSDFSSALETMIDMVPEPVPIAVLIDEHDAGIMRNIGKKRWEAAYDGVAALSSLLVTFKDGEYSDRVRRCLVTGVARIARTTMFSGANNFEDLTDDELVSQAVGFTEAEIRSTFEPELVALGGKLLAQHGGDVSAVGTAIAELKKWYNGYCFDGEHPCYAPFHTMRALEAGVCNPSDSFEDTEDPSQYVISLAAPQRMQKLLSELSEPSSAPQKRPPALIINNFKVGRQAMVPLLLQGGLLTRVPAPADAGLPAGTVLCGPPNALALKQLAQLMFYGAADHEDPKTWGPWMHLADAIRDRDYIQAGDLLLQHMFEMPKIAGVKVTESLLHSMWHAFLKLAESPDVAVVQSQAQSRAGIADVVIQFTRAPAEVWILEFGITSNCPENMESVLEAKLKKANAYAAAYSAKYTVRRAAVVVSTAEALTASYDPDSAAKQVQIKRDECSSRSATSRPAADGHGTTGGLWSSVCALTCASPLSSVSACST